jgi:hypothetical protein
MMSSMVWACLILSPTTLHSVSNVVSCYRVTWHCSGARRVVIVLASCCSSTVDVCPHALQVLTALPACLHVLQAHDGPDVRRLGNVHVCVGNMHT